MAINLDHQRDKLSTTSQLLTLNTTGALVLPSGTTVQATSTIEGQLRYDTDKTKLQQYQQNTDNGDVAVRVKNFDEDIIELKDNVSHKNLDGLINSDSSIITDNFISEVEIAKIFICSSERPLNILYVTPGVETIPAPTIEILATLSL